MATNTNLNGTSGPVPIAFTVDVLTGSDTINVNDDKGDPGNWVDLGSTDKDHTFEYSQTFDCSDITYTDGFGQKTIHNIAEIVETSQQATEDVTVNCTQRPGSISFTKVVNWGDTVNHPSNPTFELCIQGPIGQPSNAETCSQTTGGQVTFSNLTPGMYTLGESSLPTGWTTSLAPNPSVMFAVAPGVTTNRPTVTNTYHPGSLEVAKTVNLQGADPSEAAAQRR